MTYDRVHKMVLFYSDSIAQSKYTEKINSDWNAEYGIYIPKVDSISNYWKKYNKEKLLNNDEPVFRLNISKDGVLISENEVVETPYTPYSVELLLGVEENDSRYMFYKEKVIKELLYENYMSFRSFKFSKIDSIAETIDPRAREFIK